MTLPPCGITAANVDQSQAESQARQFEGFKGIVNQLRRYKDLLPGKKAKLTDKLFRQYKETDSLVEILDIQDELKTIKSVFSVQKQVLDKFRRRIAGPKKTFQLSAARALTKSPGKPVNPADEPTYRSSQLAEGNSALVDSNISAVEEMMKYADKLSAEVSLS
jgi:hypothetical protein